MTDSDIEIARIPLLTEKNGVEVSLSPVLEEFASARLTDAQKSELGKIFGKPPDAIEVLANGTVKHVDEKGNISWRSPGYDVKADVHGLASGAVLRVASGAIGAHLYPDAKVIVGGRYPNDTQPAPAEVMSKELQEMGVLSNRIVTNPYPLDTIGELARLLDEADQYSWNKLAVVTNKYHGRRVETILRNLSWLTSPAERTQNFSKAYERYQKGNLRVSVIPAEEVVQVSNPTFYNTEVEPSLSSQVLAERIASEQKGISLIEEGRYSRIDPSSPDKHIELIRQ